ncbi:MAG: hypothetical protein AAF528_09805, partial [Cyanobacteria bacterium P01_C01_bin.121]
SQTVPIGLQSYITKMSQPEVNPPWSGASPRRFAALGNVHQDRGDRSAAQVGVGLRALSIKPAT